MPVDPDGIPASLKTLDRWVAWSWSWVGTKWDKPPLNARTGRKAKSNDSSTWSTFDVALAAHQAGRFEGIGIVLGEIDATGKRLAGFDQDGLDHTGVIDPQTGKPDVQAEYLLSIINSYSEISPRLGVKTLLWGKLPPGKHADEERGVELYDSGRYFTITGRRLTDYPAEVCDRQRGLTELHAILFPPVRPVTPQVSDRDDAIATLARLDPSYAVGYRDWIGVGMALHSVDPSPAMLQVWDDWSAKVPAKYKPGICAMHWKSFKSGGGITLGSLKYWAGPAATAYTATPSKNGHHVLPTIQITTAEAAVNDQAVKALTADPSIYQRSGGLVHVVRMPRTTTTGGIKRPAGAARIAQVMPALLRERLAANATWQKFDARSKKWVDAHPPDWCVHAVAARGQWSGIRHLEGAVDAPVLRPDGTILDRPGYDSDTGLLYMPDGTMPNVPSNPTANDVSAAMKLLLDLVCDFPFATREHRSAWLAYLLTPLGRHAFEGPAPLFLLDSNMRGSGKGLLCSVVALIVTGRDMPVTSATANDDAEMRKSITSAALGGDRLILLDNVTGSLGCASLDAALTSTVWTDRVLGKLDKVSIPMYATWAATGNNVMLRGDTTRRVCHIRLESPQEHPEDRSGFQVPDLRAHVREHRGPLLAAALTILRGYCDAGRPDMGLSSWGSFEGWSALIRSAIVWAGLPDPGMTRIELRSMSEADEASALAALLAGIEHLDSRGAGILAKDIHDACETPNVDPVIGSMRDALCHLCPGKGGKELGTVRSIGMRLHHLRKRVCGGKQIDRVPSPDHSVLWRVIDAAGLRDLRD